MSTLPISALHAPRWFDPRVSVGNIFTIIVALGGIIAGYAELRADNRKQDADIVALQRSYEDSRRMTAEAVSVLRADVLDLRRRSNEISEKLADKQALTAERLAGVEARAEEILRAVGARAPTLKNRSE